MASKRKSDSTQRMNDGIRKAQRTKAIKQGSWFNPYTDYTDELCSQYMTIGDDEYLLTGKGLEMILVPAVIHDEFIPF